MFVLAGCAKREWSKDALVNACLEDFTARNEKEKRFEPGKIPYLCDCIAERMIKKFKTEKESEEDPAASMQIGRECTMEIMQR